MEVKKRKMPIVSANVFIYFAVMIAFAVTAWLTGHWDIALFELMIVGIIFVYHVRSKRVRNEEVASYLENLTFYVDSATRDSVLNFPLPMVVLESEGNIIWYNSLFTNLIGGGNMFEKPIQAIFPEINITDIIEEQCSIRFFTEFNNRFYEVVGSVVESVNHSDSSSYKPSKSSYSIVLYLVDRSEESRLEKFANEREAISSVLMIDNYDEIMQNIKEHDRPLAIAGIENKINEWVSSVNGVATKYEKDKYFVVFENKYLSEQINLRFNILKEIEELEIDSKIHATLSIGIGQGGANVGDNYNFARAAVDMALGRGGNQAVIKNSEQFLFFGGNTHEVEKRTKVRPRVIAHALMELVQQSQTVLIMGHKSADADSIGASVGLCRVIRNLGYRARIVIDKTSALAPELIQSLEDSDLFLNHDEAINICNSETLLIVVDTHKPSYVECSKLLEITRQVVVIDHHRKAAEMIHNVVISYMEPYASSACEMVTEMIQYMEEAPQLRIEETQALYAGIVLDTKNFTFKTGVRTFEAASFLKRMGVDTIAVRKLFQNDLTSYVKRARIVVGAKVYKDEIAISVYDGNGPSSAIIISQSADELLNISGVKASFVLCTCGNEIIISGRSLGGINVQVILEKLGGGGHMTVAGAQLPDKTIEETIKMLTDAIDEYYEA